MKDLTKAAVAEIQELVDGHADVFKGLDWIDLKENGAYDADLCLVGLTGQLVAQTFLGEANINDENVNDAIELGGTVSDALDNFTRKEIERREQDTP